MDDGRGGEDGSKCLIRTPEGCRWQSREDHLCPGSFPRLSPGGGGSRVGEGKGAGCRGGSPAAGFFEGTCTKQ